MKSLGEIEAFKIIPQTFFMGSLTNIETTGVSMLSMLSELSIGGVIVLKGYRFSMGSEGIVAVESSSREISDSVVILLSTGALNSIGRYV